MLGNVGRFRIRPAAFRDNKINERVLPNLTQEDLKEIGVGPVGHRRILLDAITALRVDASGKASSTDVGPPSKRHSRSVSRFAFAFCF
jgi:hypothetical protein